MICSVSVLILGTSPTVLRFYSGAVVRFLNELVVMLYMSAPVRQESSLGGLES